MKALQKQSLRAAFVPSLLEEEWVVRCLNFTTTAVVSSEMSFEAYVLKVYSPAVGGIGKS